MADGDGAPRVSVRPKAAASLILIRQDADGPRYLMGRRADTLVFMPGYYVFPGGRLERGDRSDDVADPIHAGKIGPLARRLAACALRELTEETGLILPLTTRLTFVARAITPPGRIRRFDTRFFAAEVHAAFGQRHEIKPKDDELDPIGWFRPAEIPDDRLHLITRMVIDTVANRLGSKSGLASADHVIPCHRFRHGKPVVETL